MKLKKCGRKEQTPKALGPDVHYVIPDFKNA